ncbi:VF530 family protein [Pantoea sp. GD03673]|uniref:VF530 family protein n=1 Tax=Pantoea sp. GD03673 TaxID=2975364 RepID=UPI002448EF22|nr:VF530 family protein [Pantoea sp. GD03673]MDH2066996.1 VF530 family protein [Pantoea sp. GD03673]
MNAHTSKDPLHGVTLEMQINSLVAQYGWAELGKRININCFKSDPSVKSSLKFLRRTPWARAEVEALYLASLNAHPASRDASAEEAEQPPACDPWGNWRGNTPQ